MMRHIPSRCSKISDIDGDRPLGNYVGRILDGAKPIDLPVVQSTKVELFINLKTAKALGNNLPLPLVGRAGYVIEKRCCLLRRTAR